jgi:hypothetical protein
MKFLQHKKKIITVVLAMIVFSAIMLQLAGCSCSSKATTTSSSALSSIGSQSSTTSKTTTTQAAANVPVKSADGTISISAPSGWNLNDLGLYPGAVVGIANDANSEYLIITKKPKTDVGTNSSIDDYMALVQKVFGLVVTGPVWSQSSKVTIGGCSGLAVQLTGIRKSNSISTVYYINAVASKDYYYNICGYTDSSMSAANQAQLETIIKSFKETN